MTSFRSALITGATGFIGSALVHRLLQEQVEVTCIVRHNHRPLLASQSSLVRTVEFYPSRPADLRAKLRNAAPEVIFHLASYGVKQEDRDLQQLLEGNVSLLVHLLEATSGLPVRRFIHAGSCAEYGPSVADEGCISEMHPLRPTSVYGAAKAASFLLGNTIASRLSIPFVTLRLFGVFGTREDPDRLLPYLIRRLDANQPVDLTPGEQVRDFLFESDVVDAFILAAKADGLPSYEVYNVCSGSAVTVRQVGEAVATELERPFCLLQWGRRQYRSDEPMWLVGDNRKFKTAVSWTPTVGIQEGVRRMISSMRLAPEHHNAI